METTQWGAGYFFWYLVTFLAAVGAVWWGRRGVSRRRRWVRIVTWSLVGVVMLTGAGCLAGEAYFTFAYDNSDYFGFLRSTRRWLDRYVVTNSIGLRDGEWEDRGEGDDGVVRIGFLGDGVTFGQGVEDPEDRFTNRLARRLNGGGDSVHYEVLNIALPHWDTGYERNVSRDLIPFLGLDELVLVYNMDDARYLTFVPETLDLLLQRRPGWSRWLVQRSMLADFVLGRRLVSRGLNLSYSLLREAYETPQQRRFHLARLREIRSVAARLEIPMRAVIVPLLAEPWDTYSFAEEHPRMRATMEEEGIEVLDLLDTFRNVPARELWAGPLDPHPNEQAHALAADAIYDAFYHHP